ncbi:MAG: ABC transporter ATP-binding protein, partial [Clostridiales bacterium]|nr:ABC transporter ATP-binding protein [Clostridiales bacterium]
MLQLKNISKSYTTGDFTQVALDDVSLNFRKNEFVAILGQSGSGKTTFLNIIGGLDRCASGDLIINGKSTKRFKDKDWDAYRNNSIGFVFQSYNLISHLNIVDNVEMGMTLSGVPAKVKRKKTIEVLTKVGLKDHLHKKPNQLSGGQMQRVAIARALANDPDIILADEPTGALDTHTSEQILDLIKEVAKDKLVIMVTHNKELAEKYADRIVSFSDGKVVADSNPKEFEQHEESYKLKKTSMSFFTALKLSGKNIITKKWRTFLTSFASSIGIIGIALILSLSNGFDKQINDFETSTLSNFPIIIQRATMDMDIMAMREMRNGGDLESFPSEQVIFPFDPTDNMVIHTNVLTKEYIDYIKALDASLIDGVSLTRSARMNLLRLEGDTAVTVKNNSINFSSFPKKANEGIASYLENRYDLIYGELPTSKTDLVLVLDEYNRVNINMLKALGIDKGSESVSFDELIGYELKLILNDDFYVKNGDNFTINGSNFLDLYNSDNAITLTIVGI